MEITLTRPDDWHLHLRDGPDMASVLPHSAARFARAIVMPNLTPPVTHDGSRPWPTVSAYSRRYLKETRFDPLMTLYLTDNLAPQEIHRARASGAVSAAKLYPAGATTNSDSGVTRLENIYPALEAMQAVGPASAGACRG